MGKILEVKEDALLFKDIDMSGKWDEDINTIPFEDITQITYGDNYSKMYYRYVKK